MLNVESRLEGTERQTQNEDENDSFKPRADDRHGKDFPLQESHIREDAKEAVKLIANELSELLKGTLDDILGSSYHNAQAESGQSLITFCPDDVGPVL